MTTQNAIKAEQAMIAICVHLCLSCLRDDNLDMWLAVLRDVTADCRDGSDNMTALWLAADAAAHTSGPGRDNAITRLRHEVRSYFMFSAANRVEAWRDTKPGRSRR